MRAMPWDELTRQEQRLLIRLFGGGSLRNQKAADIEGLSRRGFIDDEQNLSMPGLLVLTLAMREQQAAAHIALESRKQRLQSSNPPTTSS